MKIMFFKDRYFPSAGHIKKGQIFPINCFSAQSPPKGVLGEFKRPLDGIGFILNGVLCWAGPEEVDIIH